MLVLENGAKEPISPEKVEKSSLYTFFSTGELVSLLLLLYHFYSLHFHVQSTADGNKLSEEKIPD